MNESIIINTDDRSKEIGKERTSTGSTKVTDDENDFPVTVKQIFDESYKRYNHSRVLPIGSTNNQKTTLEKECKKFEGDSQLKKKFICDISEGEFLLTLQEWADIYDENNNILKEGIYVFVLKSKIFQFVNNTCTINVKKYWFTKNRKFLTI